MSGYLTVAVQADAIDWPSPSSHVTVFACGSLARADREETSVQKDKRVDVYIRKLPAWQQDICRRVREIAHRADPDMRETIKRSTRPYFVLEGNVCALLAAKSHVNVFIYDPIAPDPKGIINQGHGNRTARAIQIREGDRLDQPALLALLKAVIANNRAGGWRRIQGDR
jgi:hypothetical protein